MILSTLEKYEIKLIAPYICMALFYYPKILLRNNRRFQAWGQTMSLKASFYCFFGQLIGDSTVNDQVIFAFQAKINSNNPKEVQFSNWINNHELYKQNRKECNSDYESFQDEVYKLQDSMLPLAETL